MKTNDHTRSKLERMAYYAFTEIRNLAAVPGSGPRIAELAETAELIPEYLSRGQDVDLEHLLGGFEDYAANYGGPATRYLDIWHMTDEDFEAVHAANHAESAELVSR
jgi:hypothetical protein